MTTRHGVITVRSYGSQGDPALVLHGGPGAPGSARGLAEALASDFRVLEPLQRRSGDVPLTVDRHVEDLAQIAPARAAIVGWSWGAMLGLSYAACYPARVSALVLVGCGTYDERSRGLYKKAVANCLGEAGTRLVESLARDLNAARTATSRDEILAQLATAYMESESYEPIRGVERVDDELPPDAAGNRETWEDALRLQREDIEPRRFSAITARVVMMHGDTDPHPGPSTRDVLRVFVPQLEYVEFARCGHQPWIERYAREPFLAYLRRWLSLERRET